MAVIKLVGALYQKNLQPEPSKKKKVGTWARPTEIQIGYLRTSTVCSEGEGLAF